MTEIEAERASETEDEEKCSACSRVCLCVNGTGVFVCVRTCGWKSIFFFGFFACNRWVSLCSTLIMSAQSDLISRYSNGRVLCSDEDTPRVIAKRVNVDEVSLYVFHRQEYANFIHIYIHTYMYV